MAFTQTTEDVQREIVAQAHQRYQGNLDLMQRYVDDELYAFKLFQSFDLSRFPEMRQTFLRYAVAMGESWSERLDQIRDVTEEYCKFHELEDPRITPLELEEIKKEIVSRSRQSSGIPKCTWIDELEQACSVLVEQKRYRRYEHIIPDLEMIVASHFHNDTTGAFRYPVTFYSDDKKITRRSSLKNVPADVALNGHYQVGANSLMIVRALVDVLEKVDSEFNADLAKSDDWEDD